MILSVFSIYDAGISTWMPPLFARNKGEIFRWFVESANDPQNRISKYPADYTIFEVGSWDDDKCKFDLLKTPVSLGIAIEYVKPKVEEAKISEIQQLGSGGR